MMLVVGLFGGSCIIGYVVRVILFIFYYGYDP